MTIQTGNMKASRRTIETGISATFEFGKIRFAPLSAMTGGHLNAEAPM